MEGLVGAFLTSLLLSTLLPGSALRCSHLPSAPGRHYGYSASGSDCACSLGSSLSCWVQLCSCPWVYVGLFHGSNPVVGVKLLPSSWFLTLALATSSSPLSLTPVFGCPGYSHIMMPRHVWELLLTHVGSNKPSRNPAPVDWRLHSGADTSEPALEEVLIAAQRA